MEPLDELARSSARVDPADIELPSTTAVTINIGELLGFRAGTRDKLDLNEFERSAPLGNDPRFESILGLISRSVQGAVDFIELPHLRVLVLLSQRDTMSAGEIVTLTGARPHAVFALLDSMEDSEWIASHSPARGVSERVVITHKGRDLIDTMTERRQREIDEILGRMSAAERSGVARAFNSFAAAAGEAQVGKPKRGIAP